MKTVSLRDAARYKAKTDAGTRPRPKPPEKKASDPVEKALAELAYALRDNVQATTAQIALIEAAVRKLTVPAPEVTVNYPQWEDKEVVVTQRDGSGRIERLTVTKLNG